MYREKIAKILTKLCFRICCSTFCKMHRFPSIWSSLICQSGLNKLLSSSVFPSVINRVDLHFKIGTNMGCKPNSILYTFFWCAIFCISALLLLAAEAIPIRTGHNIVGRIATAYHSNRYSFKRGRQVGQNWCGSAASVKAFSGISISDGTGYTADSQDSTEFWSPSN